MTQITLRNESIGRAQTFRVPPEKFIQVYFLLNNEKEELEKRVYAERTLTIIQEVVQQHLKIDNLITKHRKKEVVYARQLMSYCADKKTKCSLTSIGQHLGGRDHSTISYSIQHLQDLIDTEPSTKADVAEVMAKVSAALSEQ